MKYSVPVDFFFVSEENKNVIRSSELIYILLFLGRLNMFSVIKM